MGFAFGAFAVVVGPGGGAAFQPRKPGEVEHPQEPAVVVPGWSLLRVRCRVPALRACTTGRRGC
jgi:hypothetical protein